MPNEDEHTRHALHAWAHGCYQLSDVDAYFGALAREEDGLTDDDEYTAQVNAAVAAHDALPQSVRCAVESVVLKQHGDFCSQVAPDAPR